MRSLSRFESTSNKNMVNLIFVFSYFNNPLFFFQNEFYGKVVVGHPGQTMNVAIDTAWSLTWLISAECNDFKTFGCCK